jgi:hypothetical protein
MSGGQPYQQVNLPAVIQEGPIELIPAMRVHYASQVIGAIVGAIGATLLGAGIAPLVAPSPKLPTEATQAIAQRCVTNAIDCNVLALATTTIGTLITIVGIALILVQAGLMFWARPKNIAPQNNA